MADLFEGCRGGRRRETMMGGIKVSYLYIMIVFQKWDLMLCAKEIECSQCISQLKSRQSDQGLGFPPCKSVGVIKCYGK